MTEKDDKDLEKSTKCWICDNNFVNGDAKVRGHCHITGKYRVLHTETVTSRLN